MIDDPIVTEVRNARDEYARYFNYDLEAICKDLQKKQSQSGRIVVVLPPKRHSSMQKNEASIDHPSYIPD